ncbi:hypothetical protein PUN28_018326 [Cardiocondyla obscurior]|uniref:Uncharacterized protein n=1 Tax=Cardiocondyla obscurior TaxID=286306 RepID=A0AAW2EGV0_9HYME
MWGGRPRNARRNNCPRPSRGLLESAKDISSVRRTCSAQRGYVVRRRRCPRAAAGKSRGRSRMLIFLLRFVIVRREILSGDRFLSSVFCHRWARTACGRVRRTCACTRSRECDALSSRAPGKRRQPSRCQKPAAPQLFSIHFAFASFLPAAIGHSEIKS